MTSVHPDDEAAAGRSVPDVEPAAGRTVPGADVPDAPVAPEDPPAGTRADAPDPAGGAVDRGRPAGTHRSVGRPSSATVMIAVLVALLGFALVVQVRTQGSGGELESARPEDLVRILSDLDERQERLRGEINDLEETQRQLTSGAAGRDTALADARRRAEELGILAGTLPAEGPGLVIEFVPGGERIRPETILDAVQELRGAGAEAMQIAGAGGAPVRIVASTSFVDVGGRLAVDGVSLEAPYTLSVIGGPDTMRTALNIPGGVVDSVRQDGGTVSVRETDPVRVAALHTAGGLKHARPVS